MSDHYVEVEYVEPNWGPGRVSAPLAPKLWGRHLRYAAVAVLLEYERPMQVAELLAVLKGQRFTVVGKRPAKVLAEAMAHEVSKGRVKRVGRGVYAAGTIAPTTRRRIEARYRRRYPPPPSGVPLRAPFPNLKAAFPRATCRRAG